MNKTQLLPLVGLFTKSCPTLATPWTGARRAPLPMGFSRQEHWSGLPFPSPGEHPDPGIERGFQETVKSNRQLQYRVCYVLQGAVQVPWESLRAEGGGRGQRGKESERKRGTPPWSVPRSVLRAEKQVRKAMKEDKVLGVQKLDDAFRETEAAEN